MAIEVGERLPNVTVRQVTPEGPKPVETKDYFAGAKVVLFGLPGAFTPTCHKNHLPGFIVSEKAFKDKGVDEIAMTSVNDHFVLDAWAEATGAKGHVDVSRRRQRRIRQGARARIRRSAGGLGVRSKRYSMLVDRRCREAAQHRAGARQGGRFRRRSSLGADQVALPGLRGWQAGGRTSTKDVFMSRASDFSLPRRCRLPQAQPSPKPYRNAQSWRLASRRAASCARSTPRTARMSPGQILVELDCSPLKKEVDVRAANLAAAEAVYERVVNGSRPEEIAIGEAGVGVAVARADEARAALDRAHGIEVGVSITLAQLLVDRAQCPRRRRRARGRAQEARAAQGRVSRYEDIAEAKARRDSAAASSTRQGGTRSVLGAGRQRPEPSRFWSPSASWSRPMRRRPRSTNARREVKGAAAAQRKISIISTQALSTMAIRERTSPAAIQ